MDDEQNAPVDPNFDPKTTLSPPPRFNPLGVAFVFIISMGVLFGAGYILYRVMNPS